ncbi:MAG: DMT family transporter [Desulfobacterales bacterium]|nr:DMT family transporter [Desulfobacterales bacterium]
MLASALMFTLLDGLIKLMGPEYGVWDIAFYRWGGGFVLLVAIFGWQGNLFKTHNLKLMTLRSITGCITFLSLTAAIRTIPLSTAMVLFFTFPAFSALFSALLFRERISKAELLCIVGTLIGVSVLLDFELGGEWIGYLLGLVSGVFAGFTVCLIKILRQKDGPVVIYLYFCMLGAAITVGPYCAHPIIPASGIEWLMVSGIACSSIIGQLFMNQGFQYCKSWEGGQFMTSELVFTAILGIYFLGEQPTWRFWLGGVLILMSAILLNLNKAKTISHPEVTMTEHQAAIQ